MAIQLYRPGKGFKMRGIECEMQVVNEYAYLHLLEQGWFYTPEECYENELGEESEKEEESIGEKEGVKEKAIESEEVLREKEIRERAKKAGIKRHWKKSISDLEKELANGGNQD